MNVLGRTAAPLFAAGSQLAFDHAFRAKAHRDDAIQSLHGRRHENPGGFLERRLHFGLARDLPEVRRTNFLFAFRDHDQIHRHLLVGALDRMQRREQGGLRPFLVHRATTHENFAEPGLSTSAASRVATTIPSDRTASHRT